MLEYVVKKYYDKACSIQERIERGREGSGNTSDNYMKAMMQGVRPFDDKAVSRWMYDYGLFQGIISSKRKDAVRIIGESIGGFAERGGVERNEFVRKNFELLYGRLCKETDRDWMSAASKILWCRFPDEFIIYDSFVERSIVVLQWVDEELLSKGRLGRRPDIKNDGVADCIDFYVRYQDMVYALFKKSETAMSECRLASGRCYGHDIRIFDKILWIIGNYQDSEGVLE